MASRAASVLCGFLAACGGAEVREERQPRAVPVLRLGEAVARYEIESRLAGEDGRAQADLAVRKDTRDELVGQLTLRAGIDPAAGAMAGLGDITFHFRLAADGRVLAAGGSAGASHLPLATLARAVELWPLILASLPRLPDEPLSQEGARWTAEQKTSVIGGGKELTAEVAGEWKLVRLLPDSPPIAVLEGQLTVSVLDLAAGDVPPKQLALVASVYLNLERRGIDFVSVSGDGVAWSARRLSP